MDICDRLVSVMQLLRFVAATVFELGRDRYVRGWYDEARTEVNLATLNPPTAGRPEETNHQGSRGLKVLGSGGMSALLAWILYRSDPKTI